MTRRAKGGGTRTVATGRHLTVEDFMDRLQLSRAASYRLMKRIPGCVYLGKAIRVPEAALDAFLANGGDSCSDHTKSQSIFGVRAGGAGSTTAMDGRSGEAQTSRTKHWLSRLRAESEPSTSRRPPKGRR